MAPADGDRATDGTVGDAAAGRAGGVGTWTFPRYREAIAALPARVDDAHVMSPTLRLHGDDRVSLFYAPFEWVEPGAQIVLVGLAPGRFQARNALQAARDAIADRRPEEDVLRRARYAGSFSGPIRDRLVAALDAVEIAPLLGLSTATELFGKSRYLVHLTAAVRFPVFVGDRNWTGLDPPLRRVPVLRDVVRRFLASELATLPDALVLPLGGGATDGARLLVDEGAVPEDRVVTGLPHPSPANGHFLPLLRRNAPGVRSVLAERLG